MGNLREWLRWAVTGPLKKGFKFTASKDDVQELRQHVEDMRADIKKEINAFALRIGQLEQKVSNA